MNSEQFSELELDLLLEAIYRKYKYDFRQYSKASITRRVISAASQLKVSSLSQLQDRVLNESGFFFELLQYLTIPVTEMFRDPAYFKAVREQIVPHLRTYASLKIWIAGCSTGEEAYSFAILLREEGLLDRTLIYATDINPQSIKKAQAGFYSLEMEPKFTKNYLASGGTRELSAYYETGYDSLVVSPSLRENILFTDHSLATDSVFSEVHLVSCRNVLIYFTKSLQDRAIGLFYDSLVPGGFLGVGEKENLRFSSFAEKFAPCVLPSRIYRKSP